MKRDGHTYTKIEGKEEDKRGRHIHKDREGGR